MTRSVTRIAVVIALSYAAGTVSAPAAGQTESKTTNRLRYFNGRLLSAADFKAEQEYFPRDPDRPSSYGSISGLAVAAEGGEGGSGPLTISPGHAITPGGEEVVLQAAMRLAKPPADGKSYVAVCAALREQGRRCLLLAVVERREGRVRIVRPETR
jgi:hypothetical protein